MCDGTISPTTVIATSEESRTILRTKSIITADAPRQTQPPDAVHVARMKRRSHHFLPLIATPVCEAGSAPPFPMAPHWNRICRNRATMPFQPFHRIDVKYHGYCVALLVYPEIKCCFDASWACVGRDVGDGGYASRDFVPVHSGNAADVRHSILNAIGKPLLEAVIAIPVDRQERRGDALLVLRPFPAGATVFASRAVFLVTGRVLFANRHHLVALVMVVLLPWRLTCAKAGSKNASASHFIFTTKADRGV